MFKDEMPISSIELLIERYEMTLKRKGKASCVLAPTISNLKILKTVNHGLKEVLLKEKSVIKEDQNISEEKTGVNSDVNTCDTEQSLFTFTMQKEKKEFKFNGVDEEFEVFFRNLNDKDRDKFEDCWGCDLRPTFDWQIKPVNFLSELEEVIKGIQSAVDDFMEQINPKDFFEDLCPIFDLFNSDFQWMCGADLMALMNALQLVLARYINQSIGLDLSVTSLLGPLIKFIADGLTASMESIRDILIAPLDCIRSVLVTTEALVNEFNDLAATGEVAFSAIARPFSQEKANGKNYDKWKTNSETNDKLYYDSEGERLKGEILGSIQTTSNKKGKLSYSFNAQSDLDDIFKAKKQERHENQVLKRKERGDEDPSKSFLQKLIMTINTAEKFINEFFANLIFSVKSLNNMVVGNIAFNLKLAGTILFVIDLINVVNVWIKLYDKYGVDGFSKLCEKMKEGDEEFVNKYLQPWSIVNSGPDDPDPNLNIEQSDINTCGNENEK